jgi:hypothetical protein
LVETSILLPPSLELQDGSNKSLFTASVSSLGTIVGAKKPMSLYSNPIPKLKKAKKVECDFNRMFQDIWVIKLHWAKAMMGLNGKLSMVKCKVCSYIEKKDKLLILKFDGLQKHVGQQKAIIANLDVEVREYVMNLNIQQLREKFSPYMLRVHCVAYWTNLTI